MPKPTPGKPAADTSPAPGDPRLLVEFRNVADLLPYARNSRTHSPEQVAQLAASIAEFGFTNPVLADADGIVAGHGRVMAARRLIDAGKQLRLPNGTPLPDGCVPVIDCTGWTDAQRRAYVIADNKLALNAGWDNALLASELEDLVTGGFDLDVLGFTADEVTDLAKLLSDGSGDAASNVSVLDGDRHLVLVECSSERVQQALFEELSQREGLTCKVMS